MLLILGDNMKLNIQALSRALVRSMTTIAKTPDRYKDRNIEEAVDLEVEKMLKSYTKDAGDLDRPEDIEATKENE